MDNSTFTINPSGQVVTVQIDFNNTLNFVSYQLQLLNSMFAFSINGDNLCDTDDVYNLPSPASNLVGKVLRCQFAIKNNTSNDNYNLGLIISQDGNRQTFSDVGSFLPGCNTALLYMQVPLI